VSVDRKTMLQTGLTTSDTRGRTATRSWIARVTTEGQEPTQIAIGARPITIGAGRDCDLVLNDPEVSRRHAELQATPEGVRVRDLGSTNGTFWQGSRVTEVVVPAGAGVQVGKTLLRISSAEAPVMPPSSRKRFGGLVGASLAMRELFAVLELASPSDATVLIEGESGTGKELTARAIHDHSARAGGPFVVVDCSAITENLLESHLFGHVRGAFTGADAERKGAFVEATGGTLFLDELGELPLASQAKLLRALEAQTVQPVGADRPVPVDTRVIAATHRNLMGMVDAQQFRFDLFYRLAVVHVSIPPLRERPDDVPELVAYFYEGRGIDPGPLASPNMERLMRHSWPGNVRELRNVLERAWALSGPTGASFADLNLWMQPGLQPATGPTELIDTSMPFKEAKERWVDQFEARYLSAVFTMHNGNITHAAEAAGINRRHFRTLLRKHGIIDG
jgi:DNA-binding NtrC family response regulator